MHPYLPRSPSSARLARTLALTISTYTAPSLRTSRHTAIATSICVSGPRLQEHNRSTITSQYLHFTTLITRARGIHTNLPSRAQLEEPPKKTIVRIGQGSEPLEAEEAKTKEKGQEGQRIALKSNGVQLQVITPRSKESAPAQTTTNVLAQEPISPTPKKKKKKREAKTNDTQSQVTTSGEIKSAPLQTTANVLARRPGSIASAPAQTTANVLAQEPISPTPKKKKKKREAKTRDTQSQVTASGEIKSASLQTTADVLARQPESIAVPTAPKKRKKKKTAKQSNDPIETSAFEKMASTLLPMAMKDILVQTPPFAQEWPASPPILEAGRGFLKDATASTQPVLLIPDHTVDGLCAGTVVSLTLQLLGKPIDKIHVHFVRKGQSIRDLIEKGELETICVKHGVEHIIILGQGSVETEGVVPPLTSVGIHGPNRKILVIDRNQSTSFPPKTTFVTSHSHPPIAPASMLSHILCAVLHPRARLATFLPTFIGTLADLPSHHSSIDKLKSPPFSLYIDATGALKKYTISWINKLTSLLNIFRRTPLTEGEEAIRSAWRLLQFDPHSDPSEWPTPKLIMSGLWGPQELRDTLTRLTILQSRSREELDRCKRVPPKFTTDERLALIEISSEWQIQPQLARRWVSALGAPHAMNPEKPKLLAVACANNKYAPGQVHFSVRRTAWASAPEQDVDLIALLKEYTARMSPEDQALLGENFAKGYKDAIMGVLDLKSWDTYNREGLKALDIRRGGGGGAVTVGPGSEKKKTATGKKKAETVPYTMEGLRALGIGRGGTFFVRRGAEAKVGIAEGGKTGGGTGAVLGVTSAVASEGQGRASSGGAGGIPGGRPSSEQGGASGEVPDGGGGGVIKRRAEAKVRITAGEKTGGEAVAVLGKEAGGVISGVVGEDLGEGEGRGKGEGEDGEIGGKVGGGPSGGICEGDIEKAKVVVAS